jgi:hypothetical protein
MLPKFDQIVKKIKKKKKKKKATLYWLIQDNFNIFHNSYSSLMHIALHKLNVTFSANKIYNKTCLRYSLLSAG